VNGPETKIGPEIRLAEPAPGKQIHSLMHRRSFIKATSLAPLGALFGALISGCGRSPENALKQYIENKLSYLQLGPSAVDRFLADLPPNLHVRQKGELIVNYFRLSADFFQSGCDTGRTVHYLSLYRRGNLGCHGLQ